MQKAIILHTFGVQVKMRPSLEFKVLRAEGCSEGTLSTPTKTLHPKTLNPTCDPNYLQFYGLYLLIKE